jgi:nucleoside-diphosphate-sugar epimerase
MREIKSRKKLIITGAAGLVGLNFLTQIDSSRYNVLAIDKNVNNLELVKRINPNIQILCADISAWGEWEKVFSETYCVIQLQAQISDPEQLPYIENNINSVKNVLDACKRYKIKNLIHISSSVVMSVAKDNYSNTKTRGEELVLKSKVPYTVLRPPLMYGCFDIKHLGFLTKILEISPIFPVPSSGKFIRQPLYVMNLVDIIIKLIEKKPERKIYNIIGKERIFFVDLIKIIARERKMLRLFINIPLPIFDSLLRIYSLITGKKPFVPAQLNALVAGDVFSVDNWEDKFKIKYTPFLEGIKKTINSKYYKYSKIMKK